VSIETYEPVELQQLDELPRWVKLLSSTSQLADIISTTEFVPKGLRGRPAAITATILYGDELGIGPMQSLASIAIVEGRPSPSAELLRGLIFAAGGELWYEEATDTRVKVLGRRKGSTNTTAVTWTIDQAKRAGLAGRQNWRSYPRQMLTARATAELARLIWPDVVRGLADSEPSDDIDGAVPSTDPESSPTTVRRRRRAPNVETTTAAASTSPPEVIPPPLPPSPTADDLPAERVDVQASDEQLVRLNISLRQLVDNDRDAKIRLVSYIVGRPITSSKELTLDEAKRAIDQAEGMVAGTVELPPADEDVPPDDDEP